MPKISLKSKKSLIIVLCSLVFIVCLILANYLSLVLIKTDKETTKVSSNSFELYFLSLSKSQVKNEAITHATDYQKIGAGGFIWEKDNYFHVVSSAYINKNDAQLVQNSIKTNNNIDSEIFSIKFNSFTINGSFNSDQTKVLNKSLNSFLNYYKEIYDIAISLDTSVYNEISARLAVNSSHNNLTNIVNNFELLFKDETSLSKLYSSLTQAKNISQKLCGGSLVNGCQTYSSLLKYRYLEVINIFYNFING